MADSLQSRTRACRIDDSQPFIMTDSTQTDNPVVSVKEEFLEFIGYSGEPYRFIGRNCRCLQLPPKGLKLTSSETRLVDLAGEAVALAVKKGVQAVVKIVNFKRDGTRFLHSFRVWPRWKQDGDHKYLLATLGYHISFELEYDIENAIAYMMRQVRLLQF